MSSWMSRTGWRYGVLALVCLGLAGAFAVQASASPRSGYSEDPFPLQCADFSGKWRSDAGAEFAIQQRRCAWLQIDESCGGEQRSTTIVPDNQEREAPSGELVRQRWTDNSDARVIETHRTLILSDRKVTEVTTLEQVNQDLLLQSVYVTTTFTDPTMQPTEDYHQDILRREPPTPGNDGFRRFLR